MQMVYNKSTEHMFNPYYEKVQSSKEDPKGDPKKDPNGDPKGIYKVHKKCFIC